MGPQYSISPQTVCLDLVGVWGPRVLASSGQRPLRFASSACPRATVVTAVPNKRQTTSDGHFMELCLPPTPEGIHDLVELDSRTGLNGPRIEDIVLDIMILGDVCVTSCLNSDLYPTYDVRVFPGSRESELGE